MRSFYPLLRIEGTLSLVGFCMRSFYLFLRIESALLVVSFKSTKKIRLRVVSLPMRSLYLFLRILLAKPCWFLYAQQGILAAHRILPSEQIFDLKRVGFCIRSFFFPSEKILGRDTT